MDSKLDPIFKATFRQAEPLDTRQAIRREDPADDHHKRRDPDSAPAADDPWQDVTTVSITALRAFLQNLLASAGEIIAVPANKLNAAPTPDTPAPRPADPVAARAAGAYQSTARGGQTPPASPPPPAAPGPTTTLSPDETRIIHQLISDLDILSSRHIDHLRIEKSDSFLHSLSAAAARALAPPTDS